MKDVPCIFDSLSKDSQLETKENQRWRHTSANAAAKSLTEMAEHLPELSLLLDSLENYSLCERHYNQIIVKVFYKQKCKPDDSTLLDSEEVEKAY